MPIGQKIFYYSFLFHFGRECVEIVPTSVQIMISFLTNVSGWFSGIFSETSVISSTMFGVSTWNTHTKKILLTGDPFPKMSVISSTIFGVNTWAKLANLLAWKVILFPECLLLHQRYLMLASGPRLQTCFFGSWFVFKDIYYFIDDIWC